LGLKEGLTGTPREKGVQMLIRDDGTFLFRNMPIEDKSLIEKDGNGQPLAAYELNQTLLKDFKGTKTKGMTLPPGPLTVSYIRDIRYDPMNETHDVNEKEKGAGKLNKTFVKDRAEAKIYQHAKKPPTNILFNKAVVMLGIVTILLALALGAKAALPKLLERMA